MIYIDALELINSCVENGILNEVKGNIAVYRNASPKNKAGWHLIERDILAKELMSDEYGQKMLVSALNKVEFKL